MIPLPSDGRKYTDPIEDVVAELNSRWADIGSMGIYNRRFIAGTIVWSQHAWGNAVDITSPVSVARMADGKIVRNTLNPAHMAYLDEVADWLYANRTRLGIRVILWRRSSHWNHIHIDMYPRKDGTPPRLDGSGEETGDALAFKASLTEEQKSLNDAGFLGANGKVLSVDGVLGPNTIGAMRARDQAAAAVPPQLEIETATVRVVKSVKVL
jgi:hypothetical protein